MLQIIFYLVLALFFLAFYKFKLALDFNVDIILTITSFFFAVFTGFFISRQNDRYNEIRSELARLDGYVSDMYRLFGYLGEARQAAFVKVIKLEYDAVLKNKDWKHTFFKKTEFIFGIHKLLMGIDSQELEADKKKDHAYEFAMDSLRNLQLIRKKIIVLTKENIPILQWIIIGCLALIMLVTVFFIISYNNLMYSIIKVMFVGSVFAVFHILYKFNRLSFFEKVISENTAKDVMEIIHGKK